MVEAQFLCQAFEEERRNAVERMWVYNLHVKKTRDDGLEGQTQGSKEYYREIEERSS